LRIWFQSLFAAIHIFVTLFSPMEKALIYTNFSRWYAPNDGKLIQMNDQVINKKDTKLIYGKNRRNGRKNNSCETVG
jgi:hypothetical protein